jgi:hypothetical protein
MKTTKHESELIWEMYSSPEEDFENEMDFDMEDDDDDYGMDDDHHSTVVMSMEPIGKSEPIGDSHMNEIMATELKKLAEYGKRLQDLCGKVEFDAWMVAKIVKASDYTSEVWHRLDAGADFANTGYEQASDHEHCNG